MIPPTPHQPPSKPPPHNDHPEIMDWEHHALKLVDIKLNKVKSNQ